MKLIDDFLNKITMYRLVLYSLILLLLAAEIFSLLGILPYKPMDLLLSTMFLLVISWAVNSIFAKAYRVPVNVESFYITALILALILPPSSTVTGYLFLFWAGSLAMASKYILAINKKHIFNPAAIAVVITAYALNQYAIWWVGTTWMLPLVVVVGLLIVRKIRRFDLVFSFVVSALAVTLVLGIIRGTNLLTLLKEMILVSPLIFVGTIMLTEPSTSPPTKKLRVYYGALVGFLFAPQVHIGNLYLIPELALVIGNLFSYVVSPKRKMLLALKEKIPTGKNLYDFVFTPDKKMDFQAGQYLEWTLGQEKSDTRGNRRYFTIASSPAEPDMRIGVKFYEPSSSFKKTLLAMNKGDTIFGGQLAGDFTLPKDRQQKLVFIAGGIGITPFRSIIQSLLDANERRDIVLFYSNKTADEIVYRDVFDEAAVRLGVKIVYTLTDLAEIPSDWQGRTGFVNEQMIKTEVPDYQNRWFYISGPHVMVVAFEDALSNMKVPSNQIKIDFFPGYV